MSCIFLETVLNLNNKQSDCSPAETFLTDFNSICGGSISPRLSFDEGRNWDKYSFTSSPLYVDGVLGEPGEDILIMT